MSARRLLAPLALVAACAHSPHGASSPSSPTAIAPTGPVKAVSSEDDYNTARGEYDAILLHAPERTARRAVLETWLMKQLADGVERGHLEEAYEQLKQAATLYDPEELAGGKVKDDALLDGAVRIEQAFKKRGAHEQVLVALMLEMSLQPGDSGVRARYDGITGWLRAGGATESEAGATVDGRGRVIDDLETVARLWPSPFVVDELTRLYFERHDAGIGADPLGLGRRRLRGNDLRAFLQAGPRPSTAYDLARLYLRISKPDEAVVKLAAIKTPQPGDDQIKTLIQHWAGKQATPPDAINVAGLLAQGHDDADVAERVCVDAAARFPQAAEPHLCAGQIAMARDQLVVAMREFEAARQLQPASKEIWQQLARLWQARLFAVASNENLDVSQLEPQLKKVEAFHEAAAKQFAGAEKLHPSMADALFEVGRGYYNAGRMPKAMEYLERSLAIEPSATALEQMGQIRLKKGEAKEAVTLFERGISLPKSEKFEEVYWRAKLRRDLGDAYETAGDAANAENARRSALADWDTLVQQATLTNDGKAEAGIERAKLWYQLGDRDQSLASFEAAIDAAPDRGGTYADVIAFLVPRGELDEALDAYHRALGRNEVTDYLKVYCSLWIVDLARRAKAPIDPLAASYLQSTDGGKWYDDLARWATGRETEQQLMGHVDTPAKRAESSYYRAMRAVENGDADGAKKLWKEVVDTDMMAFFEYDMAQMFLRSGSAPAHPLLKSKGTYKPPATTPKPPEGSI